MRLNRITPTAGDAPAGMDLFATGATDLGAASTRSALDQGRTMMDQIKKAEARQMRFQTEMGLIQMMVKMNEALAKMLKSIGEAIKGLA
jgi:hypothetical protein